MEKVKGRALLFVKFVQMVDITMLTDKLDSKRRQSSSYSRVAANQG